MTGPRPRTARRMGYIPDLADHRDLRFGAVRRPLSVALPPSVDLRHLCPPVVDQGDASSCTANALAGAIGFLEIKDGIPFEAASRLMIYYGERVVEDCVNQDNGAMIRDGIKVLAQQGVCSEMLWPYDLKRLYDSPPEVCYDEGAQHQISVYARIESLDEMRGCLASGYPVIYGFSVFSSFESDEVAHTGIVPMPTAKDAPTGGHAVLAVGFADATQMMLTRNSWGPDFALGGYFWLPYEFFTAGLVSDCWTIRRQGGF